MTSQDTQQMDDSLSSDKEAVRLALREAGLLLEKRDALLVKCKEALELADIVCFNRHKETADAVRETRKLLEDAGV